MKYPEYPGGQVTRCIAGVCLCKFKMARFSCVLCVFLMCFLALNAKKKVTKEVDI